MRMLDTLDSWIDDIPPQPTPQRFGNLAFRTWGKRLEDVRPFLVLITPQCDIKTHPLHP
jgi:serine/threonine-protein phosphatase 2A activator